jgi:hypothetical protein
MCSLSDKIQSLARASALKAHEHEEHAEKARDAKQRARGDIGGSREHRRADAAVHDAEIDHHERQARIHRRRQEYAEAGVMLHGPDEGADADYMAQHGDLFREAGRAGVVRYVSDRQWPDAK